MCRPPSALLSVAPAPSRDGCNQTLGDWRSGGPGLPFPISSFFIWLMSSTDSGQGSLSQRSRPSLPLLQLRNSNIQGQQMILFSPHDKTEWAGLQAPWDWVLWPQRLRTPLGQATASGVWGTSSVCAPGNRLNALPKVSCKGYFAVFHPNNPSFIQSLFSTLASVFNVFSAELGRTDRLSAHRTLVTEEQGCETNN